MFRRKFFVGAFGLFLVFFSGFVFAQDPGDVSQVSQMFSFEDLGIDPGTSAEEIARKAVALQELAKSIAILNEQRLQEIEIQMQETKAKERELKNMLGLMKEQNKSLQAQAKILELKLRAAALEAEQ